MFVIITSKEMTVYEALDTYRNRIQLKNYLEQKKHI